MYSSLSVNIGLTAIPSGSVISVCIDISMVNDRSNSRQTLTADYFCAHPHILFAYNDLYAGPSKRKDEHVRYKETLAPRGPVIQDYPISAWNFMVAVCG